MWSRIPLLLFWVCLIRGGPVTTPAPEPKVEYRLPTIVEPINYNITITPDMPTKDAVLESTFTGNVVITATVKDATSIIKLHAKDMNITSIKLSDQDIKKSDYSIDNITDILTIKSTQKIPKNTNITLTINYKGNMRSDMYGFYLSSYDGENSKTEYIGSTQMQPTHARRAFPCFDEPSFKATFEINITNVPSEYSVLSNMQNTTNIINSDKTVTYHFTKTPRMSSYLVAFVVSKFVSANGATEKFTVWSRPGAKNQAQYAQDIGGKVLKTIGEFTKIDYYKDNTKPLESGEMDKMAMIAIPDFAAGAMENYGLLTYRETALLYDPKLSSLQNRQRVASVIAHEQAHQWFGDLVTLSWWNNTWLNEGFATYFEYHALAAMKEKLDEKNCKPGADCWEMKKQFVLEEHQTALIADSIKTVAPMENPNTNSPSEVQSHFGAISYNKGGSVIRMMEHILTTDVFKNSLTQYLKKHRGNNTVPKDLFDEMQAAMGTNTARLPKGKKMHDVMKNWIEKPGYPVVSISLNGNNYTIEQSRFLMADDKSDVTDEVLWSIPIFYAKKEEQLTGGNLMWLETKNSTFANNNESDWIVLNVGSSGYYRVKYSQPLLDKIKSMLNTSETINTIPDINRAVLVDDVLNLARANKTVYKDALKFLEYLKEETNYFPWSSAFAGYRFLMQRYAENDSVGKNLRKELLKIMGGALYKYKDDLFFVNKTVNETVIDTYSRVQTLNWACNLGEDQCVQKSVQLFNAWMKKPENEIPVDIKSTVFCTALRNETSDSKKTTVYFDFLWKKYIESDVAADKITIINSIGCSKNKYNLDLFLNKSLDEIEVRKQDASFVFTSVYSGNDANIKIALNFLKLNWKKIETQYGGLNALSKVVAGLGDRLSSKDDIKTMTDFLNDKEVGEKVKDVKQQVLLTMKANLEWSENRNTEIRDYLCEINKDYEGCSKKGAANSISSSVFLIFLALIAHFYSKI